MGEEKPPGPQYIATKQIPRVEVPQNTLDAVLTEVRAMRADIQLVANDVSLIKDRVRIVEKRVDDIEERGNKHSGGVRQLSETDAKHDAAIAMLITKVDRVEQKTDAQTAILEKLAAGAKQVASNPKVQLLAGILWTALLGYLASKGLVAK